jgi:hypothetical protein
MQVRRASLTDIPRLTELFLRLKRSGPYGFIPHDLECARKMMRHCIGNPQRWFGVVDVNGEIHAALMGGVEQFWWSKRRYASDLAFFSQVPRGGELLISAFCSWAWKQRGVVEVLLGQSSGDALEATRSLFASLNFEEAGGIFRLTRYDALGAVA